MAINNGPWSMGLWSSDGKTLIANVAVTTPLPLIITFGGNSYAYSRFLFSRYIQTTPQAVVAATTQPKMSVLAWPQY